MLVSLEGPDRAGKSTLFQALRADHRLTDVVFVPSLPATKNIMAIMGEVEIYAERLWRHLYDPTKLYIVDRHMALSAKVYAQLNDRSVNEFPYWKTQSWIVYVDVPLNELRRRYAAAKDELFDDAQYAKLKFLYEQEVRRYQYYRIDGRKSTRDLVELVVPLVESLRK